MSWVLKVKTKSSGEHSVSFETEEEAKAALERAREVLQKASRNKVSDLATFEDQIVVPAPDVTALTAEESSFGVA